MQHSWKRNRDGNFDGLTLWPFENSSQKSSAHVVAHHSMDSYRSPRTTKCEWHFPTSFRHQAQGKLDYFHDRLVMTCRPPKILRKNLIPEKIITNGNHRLRIPYCSKTGLENGAKTRSFFGDFGIKYVLKAISKFQTSWPLLMTMERKNDSRKNCEHDHRLWNVAWHYVDIDILVTLT